MAREETGRPLAVLVSGAPGSGKSTVGLLLARRLGAALLDLDTATASLSAVVSSLHGSADLDDPEVVRLTREPRYQTLLALAEDSLSVGTSVVLVAPFSSERRDPSAWEAVRHRLVEVGALPTLVWLRISADEVVRRVSDRAAVRDRAKLEGGWTSRLDLGPPVAPHVEVDALHSPESIVDQVALALGVH